MKLRTVWSTEAVEEFEQVCEYWSNRKKSSVYNRKLFKLTQETIGIIQEFPDLGINSNSENIKMPLVESNYYLIYKISKEQIEILKFWETRQNPEKRTF